MERSSRRIGGFKDHELFSELRIPPNAFFAIRCDGRSFRDLCESLRFAKPFDREFARSMVEASKAVFEGGFNPLIAYIQSDEASFVFDGENAFNRRLEKLVSIIPSLMSSKLALWLSQRRGFSGSVAFDARVVLLSREDVVDYLAWRQLEAWRNHVNSYAYYTLLAKGYSPKKASSTLRGLKAPQLHELVYREAGINLAKTPTWQRRGIVLRWEVYRKVGRDPVRNVEVEVERVRLVEDWQPPVFISQEGRSYLEKALEIRLAKNRRS